MAATESPRRRRKTCSTQSGKYKERTLWKLKLKELYLNDERAQEWIVQLERAQFHKCDLCPKAFITSDDLLAHTKVHENKFLEHASSCYVNIEKVDILSCDSCRQGFLSQTKLLLHRVKHVHQSVRHAAKQQVRLQYNNENIAKPYQCPECDYKFVAKSTLEAHSIVHQPYPHVCYCGIGYYKELDLKRHIKLVKCKPKIEEIEIPIENPNGSFKVDNNLEKPNGSFKSDCDELKENLKVRFPFKKKQSKRPVLKAELKIKSHGKIKRGPNLPRTPLDVEFKCDKLNRWQCPKCLKWLVSKNNAQLHYRSVHRGEKPYHCHICSKSFTQSGALKKHIQEIHIGERNFECEYCDKKFKSLDQQLRHERIHTGYKPFRCTFCEKAFSDPSAHARHERIHTGDKRYKCPYCPKAYTDNSALYVHKKRHLNQRHFQCSKCSKKFYTLSDLKKHLNSVHIKDYKYTCDYCHKDFSSKCNVASHIRRRHTDHKKIYKCNVCFQMFAEKQYLQRHIDAVHNDAKKFTCEICLGRFISNSHLLVHMQVHINKREFECDHCNRRYNTKAVLSSHIVTSHLCFACKECGRNFTAMSELKKHKLSVSERCDICDKELFCEGGLSSHLKKHATKEDIYECDYCRRVFKFRHSIRNHILRYHMKPRFICDLCNRKFPLKESLRSHMMISHLECHKCSTCKKPFYSKIDLAKHKNKGCTVVKCDVCDKSFWSSSLLRSHFAVHIGKRERVKCPLCAKELCSKQSAVRHLSLMHGKKINRKKVRKDSSSDFSE